MTLQAATTATTASDAANIQTRDILTSLVMDVIDIEITAQSTREDLDERTYKAEFVFSAAINETTGVVEVIQSDDSKVLLIDIEGALIDAGYRFSCKPIKSFRIGVDDKVKLQVAWG